MSDPIPLIGGEKPTPGGPIGSAEQLAYVLSEMCDDYSPSNIRRWLSTVNAVWPRLTAAIRDEIVHEIGQLADKAAATVEWNSYREGYLDGLLEGYDVAKGES